MRRALAVLLAVVALGMAQRGDGESGAATEVTETGTVETTETASQSAEGEQTQQSMCGGGGIMGILPIVAMVAIFYFLIIRPQQKQQKKLQEMRDALTKGDRITTSGGIHGVVTNIKGSVLTVRIADGVKVDVEKDSVTVRQGDGEE
jgi:preprotein translocase subunit YajC